MKTSSWNSLRLLCALSSESSGSCIYRALVFWPSGPASKLNFSAMKRKGEDNNLRGSSSKHIKLCLAKVAVELKVRSLKIGEVTDIYKTAGYDVGLRTLGRWVSKLEKGEEPFVEEDKRGGKKSLSPQQENILVGYVLHKNNRGISVNREMCSNFLENHFDVTMSLQNISKYLEQNNLSLQFMGSRELTKVKSYSKYMNLYYQWLLDKHNALFFHGPRKLLASIDFMSNSRRIERLKTYSPIGQKQRKFIRVKVKYTDCYLTLLWADGVNRTPALLFTYNPDLDPDGPNADKVLEWCLELGLTPDRIYYKKSKKTYYAEDTDMVSTVLDKYKRIVPWAQVHMMHDAGNSFYVNESDVFDDGWCSQVAVYEPTCHGELSPNDNSFHGIVKNEWKHRREKHKGEAKQALYLLHLCDKVEKRTVAAQFTRNFLLDKRNLQFKHVEILLKPNKKLTEEQLRHHSACSEAYKRYKNNL